MPSVHVHIAVLAVGLLVVACLLCTPALAASGSPHQAAGPPLLVGGVTAAGDMSARKQDDVPTKSVDQGVLVLALQGTSKVFALDASTGGLQWQRTLSSLSSSSVSSASESVGSVRSVGSAGGIAVVHTGSHLMGLNAATGAVRWGPLRLGSDNGRGPAANLLIRDGFALLCRLDRVESFAVHSGAAGPISNDSSVAVLGAQVPGLAAKTTVCGAQLEHPFQGRTDGGAIAATTAPLGHTASLELFNVHEGSSAGDASMLALGAPPAVTLALQQGFGAAHVTGIDARSGEVAWSVALDLRAYRPLLGDGAFFALGVAMCAAMLLLPQTATHA